jgi:hypothetical protein
MYVHFVSASRGVLGEQGGHIGQTTDVRLVVLQEYVDPLQQSSFRGRSW